jgi:hypothetical protein
MSSNELCRACGSKEIRKSQTSDWISCNQCNTTFPKLSNLSNYLNDTIFYETYSKNQIGGNHYKNMAIQPFDYITANNIGFAEGCVIKYVSRWKEKGGVQDLDKAIHFLQMLKESVGNDKK